MMASRMAADSDDYFAIGDALASSLGALEIGVAWLVVAFVVWLVKVKKLRPKASLPLLRFCLPPLVCALAALGFASSVLSTTHDSPILVASAFALPIATALFVRFVLVRFLE